MSDGDFNVMFVGTSFMGIYNIGSAQCLLDHGKGVMDRTRCVGGTSAAAIIACLMLSAPERLPEYKEAIADLSLEIQGKSKGATTPGYDIIDDIKGKILMRFLKPDAYRTCNGRLSIPLTELVPVQERESKTFHKHSQTDNVSPRSPRGPPTTVEVEGQSYQIGDRRVVKQYSSNAELIEVLLASIYVPGFADWKPPKYYGRYWVDGAIGTTNVGVKNMDFPRGRLITVSPDKKTAHQKPQDNITTEWRDVSHESFQLQPFNMFRVSGGALFPPPEVQLTQMYHDGVEDTKAFLHKFGLYDHAGPFQVQDGPLAHI